MTVGRARTGDDNADQRHRRPPRPRIELVTQTASDTEAAAIVAALEQFLAETAPAPPAAGPAQSPWQRAALREAISRSHGARAATSPEVGTRNPEPDEQEERVAVVKIIELVGSSKTSSDDAAMQALKQAQTSLRNIRAVDIVSTGIRGENLDEYRAHVRVAFLIEGTDVD